MASSSSSAPSAESYIAFCSAHNLPAPSSPHPPDAQELLLLTFAVSGWLASASDAARTQHSRGQAAADLDASRRILLDTIESLDRRVDTYEISELLDLALEKIPLQRLHEEAEAAEKDDHAFGGYDDHLASALAHWFKAEFMHWVDPIKCSRCGGETNAQGGDAQPTKKERNEGGAGRVELWRCIQCQGVERFPRYNDQRTLMRTRRGRCGEFANLFQLFLRAVGLRARYVWNAEDHVWNEYYSPTLSRWIHVDPSEGKTNQPLLYSIGWAKKMSYILAFGLSGAQDVTRGYHLSDTLPSGRNSMTERELEAALAEVTRRRRAGCEKGERETLDEEDKAEELWLVNVKGRREEEEERKRREGGLTGRESGTREWRESRQEVGGVKVDRGDALLKRSSSKPLFSLDVSPAPILVGSACRVPSNSRPDATAAVLRLTACVPSQTSAVYLPLSLAHEDSFVSTLTFRITPPEGADTGADGMAFIYALTRSCDKPPKLGDGGAGLGYSGCSDKGFAVEIDTYQTVDRTADPPTPHISLQSPPNSHHRNERARADRDRLPRLTDGKMYRIRVQLDARRRRVSVWLAEGEGEGERVEGGSEEVEGGWEWLFGVDLPASAVAGQEEEKKTRAWIGVSAACGGIVEQHDVLAWTVWKLDAPVKDNDITDD